MELANIIALVAISATLFGLMVAILMHKKQLNIQVFIAYTEKYDNLSKGMPKEWHDRYNKTLELPCDDTLKKGEYRMYLHLCSQEFYLYINGLIEENLWLIWENEIERNLDCPLLRAVWSIHKDEFKSYDVFHEYVNEFQKLGPKNGHRLAKAYKKANSL